MKLIKYLRLEAGVTQARLAFAMGTTQPALSAWENGQGTMPAHRQEKALTHLRHAVAAQAAQCVGERRDRLKRWGSRAKARTLEADVEAVLLGTAF